MPNWCSNSLQVDPNGDKQAISEFREWLGSDGFTLNKIKPMPSELEGTTSPTPKGEEENANLLAEKYGASNWYDWRLNNWGTKWDVEADVDDDDSLIRISFDSAWSPPQLAVAELAAKFPNLQFRLSYEEPGMGFAGFDLRQGDEEIESEYVEADDKVQYRQFIQDEFGYDPFEHLEESEISA
jgi:hypothetical protein